MILGLYWSRTNKYGAFPGVLTGLITYSLFSQVHLCIDNLYDTPILFSLPLSFIITIIVSLFSSKPSKESIEMYFRSSKLR